MLIDISAIQSELVISTLSSFTQTFSSVLFAGTFDHLHSGHKSVLTQALFHATSSLIIGIASQSLLTKKTCPSALEPFETRLQNVLSFIREIIPESMKHIQITMIETADAVGPAATLDFDAIVVTPETKAGAAMVNEARQLHGHKPVQIICAQILGNSNIQQKLSSTSIRTSLCSSLPNGETDLNWLHASLKSLQFDQYVVEKWWSKLRDLYGIEPWRHYHTLRHILELLHAVSSQRIELFLTIWFHDCIYYPRSSKNEEDSVALFRDFVDEAGVDPAVAATVVETILMSKNHIFSLKGPIGTWQAEFLELDLSILGAEHGRYIKYADQIRKEYSHVEDYRVKRIEFLESVKLFKFKYLQNKDELNEKMRRNIDWEITVLS